MEFLIFSPPWFFRLDVVFQFIALLIVLFIGLYSFKIYKLTKNKNYMYLFLGFLSLSIAFLFKTFINLTLSYHFLAKFNLIRENPTLYLVQVFALLFFVLFTLMGYLILVSLTHKVTNLKLISLLLLLMVSGVIASQNSQNFFNFLAFLLLLFYVAPYFYKNYKTTLSLKSFLVFVCFFLLAISHLMFLFEIVSKQLYVIGAFLMVISYLMLLINLILVFKS